MSWRRPIVAFGLAVVLSACELLAPSRPLPGNPAWLGGCSIGVGRKAVLHGSAFDPRVTWATDRAGGFRLELLWPVGYQARFSPNLELLDEQGAVVAREGDLIIGSCSITDPADENALRVSAQDVRPATWQEGDG